MSRRSIEGFTLLELLVVSVLIAVMLALTVPRVQELVFNHPLSRSTRLLVSAIDEARGIALESGVGSLLLVDFSTGSITITPQSDNSVQKVSSVAEPVSLRLEEPVSIASIWTHTSGRHRGGSTPIWVNSRGMIEPAIIELKYSDRVMSLKVSPFLAEAEVFDRTLPLPDTLLATNSMSR